MRKDDGKFAFPVHPPPLFLPSLHVSPSPSLILLLEHVNLKVLYWLSNDGMCCQGNYRAHYRDS